MSAISSGALKPKSFERHLIARKHAKSARKRNLLIGLTLTSMVDMFSLLVIFLLQVFSASPELLAMTKDLKLPTSITALETRDAPMLSVAKEGIYLDQKFMGGTEEVLRSPEKLMGKLAELRELWQKTHPGQKFKGEINLQADREIPSTTVSQVMGMLPSEAYGSILLSVVSGG